MKQLIIEINDQGGIRTTGDGDLHAFSTSDQARAHVLNWIDGNAPQDPPTRPVAEVVSAVADFCRRSLRSVSGADALFLGYLLAGIFTFGVVASSHKPTGDDSRVERVCYGIAGAIGWPLYWSWRACEGKQVEK